MCDILEYAHHVMQLCHIIIMVTMTVAQKGMSIHNILAIT